ncbi:baseplate J/gp47 family protein [Rhizobium sp. P32RR-XVIII]|uniref:baseplate J/gp47 family protein n=1 Tax=Rhizobium sp. P32RR-XVIII TaxID=2726738 RepID=UPI001456AB45|nr:baseplate J/gp47 family protein [Rhizobium sp. P32RR-XVIII]NLS02329.1 baseplate J/gp47 family protein [Rhizobium sp. P32RR-XVIII]
MAWKIRSLSDASARIRGAFRQYIPGSDSALKNSFVTIVAKVLAGLSHEFELRIAYLAKQLFLTTATGQFLALLCAEIGIYRKQASAASGMVTGTAASSTTYPAGIRLISGNITYVSTAVATSAADGTLSLPVTSEAKGAAANRDADGALSLADPLLFPDLGQEWTVTIGGLGGGADIESDESLRARGLQRKRNPPGGGTLTDYERIVLGVSGVLAAWAFRSANNPGGVYVYFLFGGRANSIPISSDVETVQAAIDAQRLIRVDDSVAVPPVARPIDVTINGLAGDTSDIRIAIEAAISAMFVTRCRPGIVGNTFTVSLSWINEAISGVSGEDRHVLAAPVADIVLTGGQFPVLGTVTYGA